MDEARDPRAELQAAVTAFTLHTLRSGGLASTVRRAVDVVVSLLSTPGGFLIRATRPGPATVLHARGDTGPVRGERIWIAADVLDLPVRQGPLETGLMRRPAAHPPPGEDAPPPAVALTALVLVEELPWGRLGVWDRPGRVFTPADEQLLMMIAAVLGAAIERDRLEGIHASIGALGFLVQRSRDPATTIGAAVRAVAEVTDADSGAVIRVLPATGTALVVRSSRPLGCEAGQAHALDPRLAEALLNDELVVIEDWADETRFAASLMPPPFRSAACLATPVVVDGAQWGRLVATAIAPRRFTPHQREATWTVANLLSAALQRARGRPAREGPAPSSGQPVQQQLRATEVALLDRDGVIVWVNQAWEAFCLANGGAPSRAGAGISYLACCDAADDEGSRDVAAAIRTAVRGDLPAPLRVLVPCHSPEEERWFDVLVSSRLSDRGVCIGAAVTLSPAE